MNSLVRSGTLIIGFLLLWQAGVSLGHFPNYILPSPPEVFISFKNEYTLIAKHFVPTLTETLLGFIAGASFGIAAGLVLALYKPLARWFLPAVIISQAIPTFAIAPLFVIWFGYGLASKIGVTVLMIFFPVASTFFDGLKSTPAGFLDLAKTMNAKTARTYYFIRIPSALPALASGLRIAAVTAPMGAIVGEWVGSSAGLGYLMLYANERMQIDMMFAVLIVIIAMSLLLYFMVDKLLGTFIKW
jgi:putative hydroxymethylpyrimidine transport system permease protein